ncbi:hypothetical protein B0H11DRAFT_2189706 [Mycena galericulata]|nr:hypothetical protein B0H11DRAFT_2189706 [Mycena galericulata]
MHVLAFAAVANLGATVFPDLIAGIRKHTSFEGVVFWTDIKATDLGLEQGGSMYMYQLGSSNLVPRKSSGDAFTTGELIFTTLHPVSQSTAPTSQAQNVWLWRCKLQRTFLKLRQATIHPSTTTRWAARQLLPGEITAMNELFLTMAGCRMEPASLKVRSLC